MAGAQGPSEPWEVGCGKEGRAGQGTAGLLGQFKKKKKRGWYLKKKKFGKILVEQYPLLNALPPNCLPRTF